MFSYRHAFHAGSHADILKHLITIQLVRYLQEKPGALSIVDTHAGAGLYNLQDGFAVISQESVGGIVRLQDYLASSGASVPESITDYLACVAIENASESTALYPGSPFILARLLRPQDRLRLFELHPNEIDILRGNINQLNRAKQVDVYSADGFSRLKGLLPPPSRRGLVLIDPSYEDKNDYRNLESCLEEALGRFATGCYAIWYPVIARRESIALPDRLKAIAKAHQRAWLCAELRVENAPGERRLQASGMFVFNPPWTLQGHLKDALPILKNALGLDAGASYTLQSGEA
jgi:23S rRNA (adenine2030-N6)-methyltransferase